MRDSFGRIIDYMRISITDRCNLRCRYCMPEPIDLLPMSRILSYEEIERIVRAAAACGITKIRITGGEPLVRADCPKLIARLKAVPGISQVSMTTNGVLLAKQAEALAAAGLDAVNVSLDTTDRETYRRITGMDAHSQVMEGIEATYRAGFRVKINAVLLKGVNDQDWRSLAELARDRHLDVRFIELMPIGYGRAFEPVENRVIMESLRKEFPDLEADTAAHGNGPAVYYRIPGFAGSVGFISAVHERFCHRCNRIRLTSTGRLKACLCYADGVDLMPILRGALKMPEADEARQAPLLEEAVRSAVAMKPQGHCFAVSEKITENHSMIQIGG